MSDHHDPIARDLLAANQRYAAGFTAGALTAPPLRRVAVVTCMDARLDPLRFLGLELGDAHIIRNAGGRVSDDALRSLVISQQYLGTREVLVIQHDDCGMTTFDNGQLRARLRDGLGEEAGDDAGAIDFLPIGDLEESVRADVERLRTSPLIADGVAVSGYLYSPADGRLRQIE